MSDVRMRIYRGRVMHAVETAPSGWLRSKCRRPHPVKGVGGTVPRVQGPKETWSAERLWYPNCKHCPPDEPTVGERIRDEREWMGFTREELASAMQLAEADVVAFEDGTREPEPDVLERLAKMFRLDSVDRLRGEPLRVDPRVMPSMSDQVCAEDRYTVHRFAEFLRNAGPPATPRRGGPGDDSEQTRTEANG